MLFFHICMVLQKITLSGLDNHFLSFAYIYIYLYLFIYLLLQLKQLKQLK